VHSPGQDVLEAWAVTVGEIDPALVIREPTAEAFLCGVEDALVFEMEDADTTGPCGDDQLLVIFSERNRVPCPW
jgi:hypothetical protein